MANQRKQEGPLEIGGLILKAGAIIDGFVFMREVGSGGMARVLLAKAPDGELCALKVLRRNRFRTGLVRFRREFRSLSRINHPNVIRVHCYGDVHGHPYIAMEFVEGPDLHSLIRSFRSYEPQKRWARTEELLVDLCRALSAIHRRGLVHRDLKPSNVLVTKDGHCKLTDFGIVKDLDPSHDPHLSTTLVGTWAYASPEQITGQAIDNRSDLYSLGVMLFAMLTGKRPFVANDMAGYLAMHRDRPAPAPRDVNRHIPAHLDEICRRLLQKAPLDRYQSAQEILYRLGAEERVPAPSATDGWEPPLVGRDLELERITNAVSALTDRRGGVLVLEGDDGSGKSRLLDFAIDRARMLGIPHHRAEFRKETPIFQVLLTIIRDVLRVVGDKAPSRLVDDLAAFSSGETLRGDARNSVYDGAREALQVALEEQPRLLVLDDLHLSHPREIHLLSFLIRNLITKARLPLLVVTTLRPKASTAADALASGDEIGLEPVEIDVESLSREDLNEIVVGLVGDTLGAQILAKRLHVETEGNAFFVTEFLRGLLAKKTIVRTLDGHELTLEPDEIATGHLEIPLGVRQMMKSRLDAVSTGDRHVLEVLAVGGRDVEFDVLLDVLEEDEEVVLDALDRLLAAGIVRERRVGDTVLHSVTHMKFSDVVYRDLNAERRPWLHRKMAAALELHYAQNPSALEVVGEHYRRAGDAGRAYRYLVAAAKRLADRSMMPEAWEITEKAGTLEDMAMGDLSLQDFRRFRRDNLSVRAQVHYIRAEWTDAEKTNRAVLNLAEEDGEPIAACEARLKLATVLRRREKLEDSAFFAEQALEASRRLHYRKGVTEALHCMAALAWQNGNLEECERMANEGLLVAQGAQLAEQRARLLLALTAAQATRGHLAAATSGLTQAEGIFRELKMKRPRGLALANIAELLTWQGEPLQARQRAHVAVDLARDLDYKLGLTAAMRAMSVAALDLGLYDESKRGLEEALRIATKISLSEEVLACQVALTQLALETRQDKEALRHGNAANQIGQERDPERYLPVLQALLARALSNSNPSEALRLAEAADQALSSIPIPRRTQVQLSLSSAWLSLGVPERATKAAKIVLQTAGSRGFRLWSLEARALMAHLTEGDDAATHRAVGQDLARDFTAGLAPEMAMSFARRPFLKWLDDPATEAPLRPE
ncbi:MAG: protein kinase [Rhodobacterales bacterium]|nr:protein kinase [Rhodobacterales bacterium]